MLALALRDAARNQTKHNSTTVLVMRSGEKYEGKVNIDLCTENSVHLSLAPGGWLTCRMDEIAAIEAKPSDAKPRL